ncbi:SPASM domain-containing protein [Roseomonas populi]|uniref:SPASM domain-containing protein n=1 Tax=Roseomonas populi TaxID=3121582 RepID=A0ABT1XAW3_9PROT|nr:SPASM domain-containing protein [Roseomonas pecuniae]MCR0984272.1 SPASM domain-containing protein [Roseomonas pecuniae]
MPDWTVTAAPATREDIIGAYRIFLGRNPDEAGLRYFLDLSTAGELSIGRLLDRFLECDEFCIATGLRRARDATAKGRLEEAMGHLLPIFGREPFNGAGREAVFDLRARMNAAAREGVAARYGIRPEEVPQRLPFVAIGTTGLCNASCIHCPTGKPETAHVPRVPMDPALFEKLVRGMAEAHIVVTGRINLGLFGDGLVDPHVIERLRVIRRHLPEVFVSVNTNGAAYNREKHRALAGLANIVTLHCEALVPETYNRLMQPLRHERVFPKINQLLEDFPGKVEVSVPVSRMNLGELRAIREHFTERGAVHVHFDPLLSRDAKDMQLYRSLALAPQKHNCDRQILEELIVDCDGRVLICCNDFRRSEPIGDLTRESVLDVLVNERRRRVRQQLDENRHGEISTCSRCYADSRMSETWRELVPH